MQNKPVIRLIFRDGKYFQAFTNCVDIGISKYRLTKTPIYHFCDSVVGMNRIELYDNGRYETWFRKSI